MLATPQVKANINQMDEMNIGMASMNLHTAMQLVLYVAPQIFEPEMRDRAFLQKFADELTHFPVPNGGRHVRYAVPRTHLPHASEHAAR